jgi:preprotein translocase subunit SecF
VELFREVKIDWLGKKWYFLGFSLIFSVAGLLSLFFWHGLPLDVDFKGGTVVRVKFDQSPNLNRIRSAADQAGLKDARIQTFGAPAGNEVIITLAESQTSEAALDRGRAASWTSTTPAAARWRRGSSSMIPSAWAAAMRRRSTTRRKPTPSSMPATISTAASSRRLTAPRARRLRRPSTP